MGRAQDEGRSRLAIASCGLLSLVLLGSCTPADTLGAAQVLTSFVAGAEAPAVRPGTGIQNGRYEDASIREALAVAGREPLAVCRARLPENEPLPPGHCGLRLVCLPGAAFPGELYVCAPSEEAPWQSSAASRLP